MTKEEAKKIGATHYWDYPASGLPIDFYKKDGDNIFMFGLIGWKNPIGCQMKN